jgi:Dyp-type peroxidase family
MQAGFLPAAPGKTPRNLFGQVDGTANPAPGSKAFAKLVWLGSGDGPDWMTGGTFLATRRIRMQLTMWDRMGLPVQEAATGRRRANGAPLSGGDEQTPLDLKAKGPSGELLIPATAHVRVAQASTPGMYRRGYSFDNGPRATGTSAADMTMPMDHAAHAMGATGGHGGMIAAMDDTDAGLLFAAFVRDPASQFIPAQKALSASDALGHFLVHTSAGLWAIPGGAVAGPIAARLFA